jgi:pimeloyl-[acyl-carrier protein] methyl ester esterase
MNNPFQETKARTTLVLLPGLDGTGIFFAPLLRHLPSWVEPVIIDYPVSGNNDYKNLLPLVMSRIEKMESFVILGWSFGGPLALMVASRFPSRVSGIILCGSFVTSPYPMLTRFRFAVSAPLIATLRALRRTRLLIPGYASSELRQAKAKTWRKVNATVLASRARAALKVDVRALLNECRSQILYIASTHDEVISRTSLDEIMDIAPQTQVVQIEGPHLAIFTNPLQSALCIEKFMCP